MSGGIRRFKLYIQRRDFYNALREIFEADDADYIGEIEYAEALSVLIKNLKKQPCFDCKTWAEIRGAGL